MCALSKILIWMQAKTGLMIALHPPWIIQTCSNDTVCAQHFFKELLPCMIYTFWATFCTVEYPWLYFSCISDTVMTCFLCPDNDHLYVASFTTDKIHKYSLQNGRWAVHPFDSQGESWHNSAMPKCVCYLYGAEWPCLSWLFCSMNTMHILQCWAATAGPMLMMITCIEVSLCQLLEWRLSGETSAGF